QHNASGWIYYLIIVTVEASRTSIIPLPAGGDEEGKERKNFYEVKNFVSIEKNCFKNRLQSVLIEIKIKFFLQFSQALCN
ncbi:MAG: hypothetical protein KAK01_00095, partial [Candidatus Marinimicrobia bacterium]|nr:hypothetical protein [Candidatus Neomarinimicrobiota bacterium]